MALRAEGGKVLVGTVTGVASILIFDHLVPPYEDVRNASPFNGDVESMERMALGLSTGLVIVTAGLMRSVEVFIIGGAFIVAIDFMTKHANALNPDSGKMGTPSVTAGVSTSYPLPAYQTDDQAA